MRRRIWRRCKRVLVLSNSSTFVIDVVLAYREGSIVSLVQLPGRYHWDVHLLQLVASKMGEEEDEKETKARGSPVTKH